MAQTTSIQLEDDSEFPTLGSEPIDFNSLSQKQKHKKDNPNRANDELRTAGSAKVKVQNNRQNFRTVPLTNGEILHGDRFVLCNIGVRNIQFRQNLAKLIEQNKTSDFIITPISAASPSEDNDRYLPDLILSRELWRSKVIVELTFPQIADHEPQAIRKFEDSLRHAFFLDTHVILITVPALEIACLTVASLVNRLIVDRDGSQSVIIRLPFTSIASDSVCNNQEEILECDPNGPSSFHNSSFQSNSSTLDSKVETSDSGHNSSDGNDDLDNKCSQSSLNIEMSTSDHNQIQSWAGYSAKELKEINFLRRRNTLHSDSSIWDQWCAFRSHINPIRNVGICLELNEELLSDHTGRWCGEPVRLVLIGREHFFTPPGNNGLRPVLTHRCQKFLTELILANSLQVGLVVNLKGNIAKERDLIESYLGCLDEFYNKIVREDQDTLRTHDDYLQLPLQPLSTNLSSDTYATFEADKRKYSKYKAAMVEALKYVQDMYRAEEVDGRDLILMVLGAGRGPLVDCFIEAIEELSLGNRCKIYALDKNPSSVIALRHKHRTDWSNRCNSNGIRIQVEIVECDMRVWDPKVKADIIATELLGSFGDNELSPECIDGVWRFSSEKTISIPREYTSYIAPITSHKIYQNVIKRGQIENDEFAFDRIYVCKLNNIHMIRQPEALFEFSHFDVSKSPDDKKNGQSNERYTKLMFYSPDDTVCHGFGAFFQANLFGTKSISTVPENKTPKMESWFPAFIPLEQPIHLMRGSMLEVHFWRKQSSTSVWYEWVVTQPRRSRIHSLLADGKGMPKMI